MSNNFKIFSFESRKGGVGKTTIALAFAKRLLEKDYHVLFIDVDMTGTNSAHCENSFIWKDITYSVREQLDNNKEGKKIIKNYINIVKLYKDQYLRTNVYPEFILDIDNSNSINNDKSRASSNQKLSNTYPLLIKTDKINILGSDIYDSTSPINDGNKGPIEQPSLLFDQLHSYLFITFLKKLVLNYSNAITNHYFNKAINNPEKIKIAIIFDNSPGYSGIAPKIQDWITDLGSDDGKIMMISSPDWQDLVSVNKTLQNIHNITKIKHEVSKCFISIKNNQSCSYNIDESFLSRLIDADLDCIKTSNEEQNITASNLSFHRYENNIKKGLPDPDNYLSIIINKVHHNTKLKANINADYDIFGLDFLYKELLKKRERLENFMVEYEETLSYQFLPDVFLSWGSSSDKLKYYRLQINKVKSEFSINTEFGKFFKFDQKIALDVIKYATEDKLALLLSTFVDNINSIYNKQLLEATYHFSNINRELATTIYESFVSKPLFSTVRESIISFLSDYEINNNDTTDWIYKVMDEDLSYSRTNSFKLFKAILSHKNVKSNTDNIPRKVLFLTYFIALNFSLQRIPEQSKIGRLFLDMMSTILGDQQIRYHENFNIKDWETNIRVFLFQDELDTDIIKNNLLNLDLTEKEIIKLLNNFKDIYKAMAHTQLRLLNLCNDGLFLADMMLLLTDLKSNTPFVQTRKIMNLIEDVIIKRNKSAKMALSEAEEGVSETYKLTLFDSILTKIIKKWGI